MTEGTDPAEERRLRLKAREVALPVLDPAFVADCPYGPEGMLLDAIVSVDCEAGILVARMPTAADQPLTRGQRSHPIHHPAHVSGGLMVHMTGIVAFAHAYYVLGVRHADGWIGYGARIRGARFHALAPPGAPLEISCHAKETRRGATRILARYDFRFTQGGTLVYESDQTAMWINTAAGP